MSFFYNFWKFMESFFVSKYKMTKAHGFFVVMQSSKIHKKFCSELLVQDAVNEMEMTQIHYV